MYQISEMTDRVLVEQIREELSLLRREVELLTSQLSRKPEQDSYEEDFLVTLSQAAALVQRSPRTLQHYVAHPIHPLPLPEVRGESGRPNEYKWSEVRPWLEKVFKRNVRLSPPTLRRVL